jgi:hypothetical protein
MDRAHFRQYIELMFQGMLTDMREAEARLDMAQGEKDYHHLVSGLLLAQQLRNFVNYHGVNHPLFNQRYLDDKL